MKTKQKYGVQIAAARIDITPEYPVSLLGYFNERRSEGVLDRLYCRLIALEKESKRLLFVQIDSCLIPAAEVHTLTNNIAGSSPFTVECIMVTASHTHTAPALADFFVYGKEKKYQDELFEKIVEGVRDLSPPFPCTIRYGKTNTDGLSFNRRWVLDDGTVMTNPPKLYPRRLRPEGPVDPEAAVVSFESELSGQAAVFVNVSNHVDTVGGRRISADWPGLAERYVRRVLGRDTILVPLIAPAGNINHFDFDAPGGQTGYQETQRIGDAYGRAVIAALKRSVPVQIDGIYSCTKTIPIPARKVSGEDLKKAEERAARFNLSPLSPGISRQCRGKKPHQSFSGTEQNADLTAVDLAADTDALSGLFARELLLYAEGRHLMYDVPLQVFSIGTLRICAVPGEPFVEMGIRLKQTSSVDVIPVSLANGYFGYIPPYACFENGGYETQTTRHNCLSEDAFDRILNALHTMLKES